MFHDIGEAGLIIAFFLMIRLILCLTTPPLISNMLPPEEVFAIMMYDLIL